MALLTDNAESPIPCHGTLIVFKEMGILLAGKSQIGKSELALELISHGAKLICDDAPQWYLKDPSSLYGRCPEGFEGQLHIRNLGILNVTQFYGQDSVVNTHKIDFIIDLSADSTQAMEETLVAHYMKWVYKSSQNRSIIIPGIKVNLYPGRNRRLIIETAIQQYKIHQQNN